MEIRKAYKEASRKAGRAFGSGLEKLAFGSAVLALGSGLYSPSKANGTPITVTSQLPRANLVADGQTVYQMNVHVDSTVELNSTNWSVYVPLDRFTLAPPPLQPQIPTTNDYFEGVAMDPSWNFVDTTIDANWVLFDNTRNTNGAFGPTGTGDLENVYFTVNTDAPLGPVTCQNCVENIAAFAFNFSDPQGALYTAGNGGITRIDGTYNIVEPGDMNFDNSVNTGDIPAFISALLDPVQYQADFDAGLVGSADSNLDGVIDARDIQGFVDRILAGP